MSHNTYGHLFRVTTWGESHGPAIGGVVDGVPPRIDLNEADIQPWLDKRRPGQSRFTTQRQEPDTVEIQSGVFEGQTTGTPISLLIRNQDANTASATTAAAVGSRRVKLRYGLQRARSPERSSAAAFGFGARSFKSAQIRSTAATGIGTKAIVMRSFVQTLSRLRAGPSCWTRSGRLDRPSVPSLRLLPAAFP
jgi:hypothetical protein